MQVEGRIVASTIRPIYVYSHNAFQVDSMMDYLIAPLTPDRWHDLEALFGPRGACAGCWDMWYRIKRSTWEAQKGEGNREAFRQIVESGAVPGLVAYDGEKAVGWVAVQPREAYSVLARSSVLKPVDDHPAWAITCFFIASSHRHEGLTSQLAEAAVNHALSHGARIIEAYPTEPRTGDAPDFYLFTGIPSTFERLGFVEVARRSPHRPIMRYTLSHNPIEM